MSGNDTSLLARAQCMSKTDDPVKCRALRDDYLECLHHRREVTLNESAAGASPAQSDESCTHCA